MSNVDTSIALICGNCKWGKFTFKFHTEEIQLHYPGGVCTYPIPELPPLPISLPFRPSIHLKPGYIGITWGNCPTWTAKDKD